MPTNDSAVGPNPLGLCMCGCGQATKLSRQTCHRAGSVKGKPMRFLCGHYQRTVVPRPDYVVDDQTGCWLWQKKITHGYAYMSTADRRTIRAARFYYEQRFGPIPKEMVVDHVRARGCIYRHCVNPDHLEPVTIAVNTQRGDRAKLTQDDVAAIKRLLPTMTQSKIAERFNVCASTISYIKRGRTWSNVEP